MSRRNMRSIDGSWMSKNEVNERGINLDLEEENHDSEKTDLKNEVSEHIAKIQSFQEKVKVMEHQKRVIEEAAAWQDMAKQAEALGFPDSAKQAIGKQRDTLLNTFKTIKGIQDSGETSSLEEIMRDSQSYLAKLEEGKRNMAAHIEKLKNNNGAENQAR